MKHENSKAPDWSAEIEQWPEAERDWAQTAADAMVFADAQDSAISGQLALVRESMAASGQRATDLFGEPFRYGSKQGKSLRAHSDVVESSLTFRDRNGLATGLLSSLGFLLVVLGLWLGFDEGWATSSFTGPTMIIFPAVFVLVGVSMWAWLLRTRGHMRAPLAIWAAVLAGFIATIALVAALDDLPIPGPPNWVMPLIGLGLLVFAFKVPLSKPRPLVDDTAWDDERWFTQAENLLRGRYLFSRKQAATALLEAREHRRISGAPGTAAQEFGNVERFTAQLVPGSRTPIKRGIVLRRASFSLVVLFFGIMLISEFFEEPITAWLIIRGVIWLCLLAGVLWDWRPKSINAATIELNRTRASDARTLAVADTEDDD